MAATQTGLLKRTAAEVVHAIETHWEVKVGAVIWRVCGHNQRTYQYLIHLLTLRLGRERLPV
eukprot:1021205-Prorocentrum_minimum.AAC.1